MLKKLNPSRPKCRSAASVRTAGAKLKAVFVSAIVVASQPVAAATNQADRASENKAKWIRICKADIQRFCDQANLKQECLIAHWSKISTECQDVLGASAGNRAGDGS
jgi:hypothetical protein